jgi:hypothetical protein
LDSIEIPILKSGRILKAGGSLFNGYVFSAEFAKYRAG